MGGQVRCWGANDDGQLGDGTRRDSARAVTVRGLSGAAAVAAGGSHTCAIVKRGRVRCWGDNSTRQLGIRGRRDRLTPVTVRRVVGAKSIAAGASHTCAVIRRGAVICWGAHVDKPGDSGKGVKATAPKRVPGLRGVSALAASLEFDCALGRRGRVWCWGGNSMGQLGDGTRRNRTRPVRVRKLPKATGIAAGYTHACAIVRKGRIACWGANTDQGLGHIDLDEEDMEVEVPVRAPVRIRGLSGQVAVTAGERHTCGLGADGRVGCVGRSSDGALGNGSGGPGDPYDPTPGVVTKAVFARGVRAFGVSAGASYTCAQLASGAVTCWGDDRNGQLGDGLPYVEASSTPLPVPALRTIKVTTVATGGWAGTCALDRRGAAWCWGGVRGIDEPSPVPTRVPGLTGATDISPGFDESCALLTDGRVSCWQPYGGPRKPAPIPRIAGATALSGFNRRCAIIAPGTVSCWHLDHTPSPSTGLTDASALSANSWGGCAVVSGGHVRCWGDDGKPATVPGLSQMLTISAGDEHSCAVQAGGAVYCWGANTMGQLGDGTYNAHVGPVRVRDIENARAVGVGWEFTCALLETSRVECWGNGTTGRLGDGATVGGSHKRSTPAEVTGITNAITLGVDGSHACVVIVGGRVRCWGGNDLGQLGQDPGWLPRQVQGLY